MVDEAMDHFTSVVSSDSNNLRYPEGIELLIVDDGSKDRTKEVALEIAQRWDKNLKMDEHYQKCFANGQIEIRVISLEKNRGKGGAVRHVSTLSFLSKIAKAITRI